MNKWNIQRLEEIIQVNPTVKLTKGEAYPFIDIDKVSPTLRTVTNEALKSYDGQSCSKFCNGDTVFSRITPCLENRKIAQVSINGNGAFGSTEFYVFRAKEGLSDKDFVYYLTSSDAVVLPAINSMTGASGRQRADRRFIEKTKLCIPDVQTQKRIADVLSTYDELIENNNKRIAILEQMAENLYKEWFVRRKNSTWEYIRLSDFGYSLESGSRPKGGIDSSLQDGYPSLGAEAIGKLGEFDYSSTKLIPEDFYKKMKRGIGKDKDILLYKDGAYIGKVTLFMDEFPYKEYAINEHVFLMRSNDPTYQYYLYFTLALPQYFTQLQNLNRNAAQPGLTGKDIDILKLYRPDKETVEKFNLVVEPMLHNIFSLAKQNQNLTKQRDLLLPRLMSGKIEV